MSLKSVISKCIPEKMKINIKLLINKRNVSNNLNKTKRKLKNGEKLKVLFIAQFPELWNSEKTVYELLSKDNRFEIKIFSVPKISNGVFDKENEMYSFLTAKGIQTVNTHKNGIFEKIDTDTDFVFLQSPYDDKMPKEYRSVNVSKNALICYIPYNSRMTCGKYTRIEFNDNFLCNFYCIFADCNESFEYVSNWMISKRNTAQKKVFNIGYPRYDLTVKSNKDLKNNITFLWTPRWSYGESDSSDNSHFLEYYNDLLDFFKNNKHLSLIIRPHPLMFSYLLQVGALTQEDIDSINTTVNNMNNVQFDDNKDYISAFNTSDCLIADLTSLIMEYYPSGKPIIFCEKHVDDLTKQATAVFNTLYFADNSSELIKTITEISLGEDSKINNRLSVIKEYYKVESCSAQRIINTLIDEL